MISASADLFYSFQIFFHSRKIVIVGQDIYRHMNPRAMGVGERDSLLHIFT